MAKDKLTALQVSKAKPGRYYDGGGLELIVRPSPDNPAKGGPRFWVLRSMLHGRRREWGLGSGKDVSLSAARERAKEYRALIRAGVDPADARIEKEAAQRAEAHQSLTFEEAAREVWSGVQTGFRCAKHRAQWIISLETYAFPLIGRVPVRKVDKSHVVRVLVAPVGVNNEPFWTARNSSAKRVYQRICHVLNWAVAHDARTDPAPPRATMANILPKPRTEVQRHHAAMPYRDVPAFYRQLASEPETMGRLALRFVILTAARSGEVRGARWSEIDFGNALWTIPAERMKKMKEHVVPLSGEAIALLRHAQLNAAGEFVFPGMRGKPLSQMTISAVLRDKKLSCTVHGFRSSFRDWAGETTTHAREVIEHALAHQLKDKTEAAYQRGSLKDKRAPLMDEWAEYLTNTGKTEPYCLGVVATLNQPPPLCINGLPQDKAMEGTWQRPINGGYFRLNLSHSK